MYVEALRVGAICPRYDVGCAQQRRLSNPGERTAAAPVVHQRIAEQVLSDAQDNHAFGLGRAGKVGRLGLEAIERRLWQAHGEPVDTIECGV